MTSRTIECTSSEIEGSDGITEYIKACTSKCTMFIRLGEGNR
jgi:hypothetical protein